MGASDCGGPLCNAGAQNLYKRTIANLNIIEAAAMLRVTATNHKCSNLRELGNAGVRISNALRHNAQAFLNFSELLVMTVAEDFSSFFEATPSSVSKFLEWFTTDDNVLQLGNSWFDKPCKGRPRGE